MKACLVCGAIPVRGVRRVVEPSCVLFQEVFKCSHLVEADGSFRLLCLVCDNLVTRLEELSREKKAIKEELGSRLSFNQAFSASGLRTASKIVETDKVKDLSGLLTEGGNLSQVDVNVEDEASNAASHEMKEKSEKEQKVTLVRAEESLSNWSKGLWKVTENDCDKSDANVYNEYLVYPDNEVESQAALPCRLCGNIFSSATKLENHTRNCSDAHIVNCKVCDKYLTKQRISSDILDFKYCLRCPKCDKLFTKKSTLAYHMLHSSHSIKKSFVCNIEGCGKSYRRKKTLVKHDKLFHDRIHNVEPCIYCGAQFRSKSGLNIHLRIHTEQEILRKEWLCTHCEKVFNSRVDLESHMVVHIQSMSYSGDICSKDLSQNVSLKDHEQANLEKPHPVPPSFSEEVIQKVKSAPLIFISKDQSDIKKGGSVKPQYLEKAMQQQRDLRYKEVYYNGVLDETKGDQQLYDHYATQYLSSS